jgi:hypothetical protein
VVGGEQATNSRMLDSEGWATMNGGGFSEMVLYSLVSYLVLVLIPVFAVPKSGYPFVRSPACHNVRLKGTLFSTAKVPEKV